MFSRAQAERFVRSMERIADSLEVKHAWQGPDGVVPDANLAEVICGELNKIGRAHKRLHEAVDSIDTTIGANAMPTP